MFSSCADPSKLAGLNWLICYLTTDTQFMFLGSFLTVLLLLVCVTPAALAFGFGGALAARSGFWPLSVIGRSYTAMVRGIPDIVFFLFVPIALDQGLEYLRHRVLCPDWTQPVRQGNSFLVCPAAKLPPADASALYQDSYSFLLAVIAFAIVFGAFAANVLSGAMNAVPRAQIETAEAYGMSPGQVRRRILIPQMWVYALPGLSNLWMILIKATPLLYLLGIQDVVYWAKELGATKSRIYAYPHPDWRLWYFLGLLVFYLALTRISEAGFRRLTARLARGQATLAGEKLRKART